MTGEKKTGHELFRADLARWREARDPGGACDEHRLFELEEGVDLAVGQAIEEAQADMAAGVVPATVRSFAELHDHVDANGYGGAFDWPSLAGDLDDDEYAEEHARFWNAVQARVDEWLKGRGGDGGGR